MNCVEKTEAIGTKCNLKIFTVQNMRYAIYSDPYMKLADRPYSVAVLVWW